MTEFVYFMRPVGMAGPIKIGNSWRPERRLRELMLWSPFPLEIIHTVPGDKVLERNLQNCFADCHSHAEWFFPAPRLLSAIAAMQSGVPVHVAVDLSDQRGSALWNTQRATRERNGTLGVTRTKRSVPA